MQEAVKCIADNGRTINMETSLVGATTLLLGVCWQQDAPRSAGHYLEV